MARTPPAVAAPAPDLLGAAALETPVEPVAAPAVDPVSQFEDSMKELEGIVQAMERGDLRLEESLKLFERGMALTKQCRGSLEVAELKVKNLLAGEGGKA